MCVVLCVFSCVVFSCVVVAVECSECSQHRNMVVRLLPFQAVGYFCSLSVKFSMSLCCLLRALLHLKSALRPQVSDLLCCLSSTRYFPTFSPSVFCAFCLALSFNALQFSCPRHRAEWQPFSFTVLCCLWADVCELHSSLAA